MGRPSANTTRIHESRRTVFEYSCEIRGRQTHIKSPHPCLTVYSHSQFLPLICRTPVCLRENRIIVQRESQAQKLGFTPAFFTSHLVTNGDENRVYATV